MLPTLKNWLQDRLAYRRVVDTLFLKAHSGWATLALCLGRLPDFSASGGTGNGTASHDRLYAG